MKKLLNVLAVVAISASVSFLVFQFLGTKETVIVERDSTTSNLNKTVGLTELAVDANINFATVAQHTVDAVVHVKSKMQGQTYHDPLYSFFYGRPLPPQMIESSGSGVIISDDGYIVTNNHVIDKAQEIEVVLHNRETYPAKLIGKDPTTDLALLKVEAEDLAQINYGNSDETMVGEWVLAVGNPFNLTSTVTAGIVSAKGRNINILGSDIRTGGAAIESFIQTDAAVNPGNSGGALVNTKGELIGINSAIKSATGSYVGYSFAIPVNIVKKVVDDLKEFGTVQRAFIGVNIRDIDQKMADDKNLPGIAGVYVLGTIENSAAEDAGLEEGDVILKVGTASVNKVSELQEQISQFRPGDEVSITLLRDGTEMEKKMTLKNFKGSTEMINRETQKVLEILGARLDEVSKEELNKLGIRGGAKVSKLWNGKLMRAGVREGYIITRIDKQEVKSSDDVTKMLEERLKEGKSGGVLFEGIYPNGKERYYGFGMP